MGAPGWAEREGDGPPGWAAHGGKEKRKGKVVWAGPKEIGKEREVFIFFQ